MGCPIRKYSPLQRAVVHAEDVQQRGLAGARRPHDRDEFARLDIERNPAQHESLPRADGKRLLDASQRHEGRRRIELRWLGQRRGRGASEDHGRLIPCLVRSRSGAGRPDQSLCRTVTRKFTRSGGDVFTAGNHRPANGRGGALTFRPGDAGAFALLVRRFQDMAVGYGYSLVRELSPGGRCRAGSLLRSVPASEPAARAGTK